ncbi:hypothetical protein BJ170DRAFT_642026 [Xylariales sp. AK1849]|nr:hypothetical protein BJ170DRAFT_642026 [Xylariales sp. AK1849]
MSTARRSSADSAHSRSGRRLHVADATPMRNPSADGYYDKRALDGDYKKYDYREKELRDGQLPGWALAQIGLRIASLILAGVVVGCSIRSYVTGLILWLPLSIVIFLWEASELVIFAANRTHGIPPMWHLVVELIITLGALAYTGLSIYEVYVFRGYRSIVEFAVATGLCTIISCIHTVLFIRALMELGARRKNEGNYAV